MEPESEQHESEGAGEPEGAFELERVEHETGGAFRPEGVTSEELEPEKNVSARAGSGRVRRRLVRRRE